jgi:hypothetical protein
MSFTAQPDDRRYDAPLRYEEPFGRHFEGLYYQAVTVARRLSADIANSIASKRWP